MSSDNGEPHHSSGSDLLLRTVRTYLMNFLNETPCTYSLRLYEYVDTAPAPTPVTNWQVNSERANFEQWDPNPDSTEKSEIWENLLLLPSRTTTEQMLKTLGPNSRQVESDGLSCRALNSSLISSSSKPRSVQ
jgi:hypothetical protein